MITKHIEKIKPKLFKYILNEADPWNKSGLEYWHLYMVINFWLCERGINAQYSDIMQIIKEYKIYRNEHQ